MAALTRGYDARMDPLFERAASFFGSLQSEICDALAAADGGAANFGRDEWTREAGGGGVTRVLADGDVFEKAGVAWSRVEGELPEDVAVQMPGDGRAFRASGVSLVLHPRSPMIPTTHANFRCIEKGASLWFAGGADLTPYYLYGQDAQHFHRTLAAACARHASVADYDRFKKWCDEYFFLPHRGETRGVGGVFFDYLQGDAAALEATFSFIQDIGRAFLEAYLPIVESRRGAPYGERERTWQLRRRGRYVEFNLLYDRGTVFGLRTGGRIESILMSLPPLARWDYDAAPEPGSREAELLTALREPQTW
jgi:coproporphyrinogen III oxidase